MQPLIALNVFLGIFALGSNRGRVLIGVGGIALGVNGGRNPPLNGGVCFPGTIFEQRLSKMSRSGVKGKRSLAQRILDAAKGQKTGIGCDRGRTHKSAFSPPFNGGFAPLLTLGKKPQRIDRQRRITALDRPIKATREGTDIVANGRRSHHVATLHRGYPQLGPFIVHRRQRLPFPSVEQRVEQGDIRGRHRNLSEIGTNSVIDSDHATAPSDEILGKNASIKELLDTTHVSVAFILTIERERKWLW
ncbi:hypothetical protein LJR034_002696 [Caballeronia sp. LjRoot34]|uniref:hypothetical protein n=1 Tax=Caballeronia sp. LjRoot34 TaxID=3342325 RepID=UPI003ED09B3C